MGMHRYWQAPKKKKKEKTINFWERKYSPQKKKNLFYTLDAMPTATFRCAGRPSGTVDCLPGPTGHLIRTETPHLWILGNFVFSKK